MRLFLFLLLEEQIQYVTGGLNPYVTIYTSFEIPSYMLGTTDLLGKKLLVEKKPRVVSLFHCNMNCSNLYTFLYQRFNLPGSYSTCHYVTKYGLFSFQRLQLNHQVTVLEGQFSYQNLRLMSSYQTTKAPLYPVLFMVIQPLWSRG